MARCVTTFCSFLWNRICLTSALKTTHTHMRAHARRRGARAAAPAGSVSRRPLAIVEGRGRAAVCTPLLSLPHTPVRVRPRTHTHLRRKPASWRVQGEQIAATCSVHRVSFAQVDISVSRIWTASREKSEQRSLKRGRGHQEKPKMTVLFLAPVTAPRSSLYGPLIHTFIHTPMGRTG